MKSQLPNPSNCTTALGLTRQRVNTVHFPEGLHSHNGDGESLRTVTALKTSISLPWFLIALFPIIISQIISAFSS
jgi:hypothetical protein